MEPGTDAEIIRQSFENPILFETVFERHFDAVRVYAQRRLGHDDGEEIASATFERAFGQRRRFDHARFDSARPWLIGIANNLVRAHLRRSAVRRRRPTAIMLEASTPEPALDRLAAEQEWPRIRDALMAVKEADRETFLLFVLSELTYSEVAQALAIPVGTVRSRLFRVRAALRELLGEDEAINGWEEE